MRRGKLNKTGYILLITSAIFTILSYVSDQLVIGYENKLREKKSSYQTLDTEIKSLESTDLILDSLEMKAAFLISSELKQRSFWIKNLFIMESEKNHFKEIKKELSTFIDEDFPIHNIKIRAKNSTKTFLYDILDLKDEYELLFNEKIFDSINFFSKEKFLEELNASNIINDNQDKFYLVKNYDDVAYILDNSNHDKLELKHWFDLRNFRLLLTENLYIQKEKIFDVAEEITKILDDKILDLDIMFYEQKRLNTFKNYFILIGIISQILTLTFLLLLFKTLITKKII
tara:strand:- start:659 stop:1519 length:861 start_codon:yes stop_codon:yes gene_type:complete